MSVMEMFNRPPMHGPTCTCGCQDCGPSWSQSAIDCWNQMSQFRQMLSQILQDPNFQMPPVKGITDGSDAKPGDVGEFIRGSGQFNFGAYPAVSTGTVSTIVIPPGDWDLFGITTMSMGYGFVSVQMKPTPPGVSDIMWVADGVVGGGGIDLAQLTMNTIRANFTVPTLLTFAVDVDQSGNAGLTAGVADVIISGRRRR